MNQSKAVYAIAGIAAIFSFIALMFAAAEYRVASHNVEIAQALTPNPDAIAIKIESPSAEGGNLLRMLRAQHGELQSVHGALLRIAADRKAGAIWHCAAWIAMSIVLWWLTIRLNPSRPPPA